LGTEQRNTEKEIKNKKKRIEAKVRAKLKFNLERVTTAQGGCRSVALPLT
jgi:hypothetical protein